MGALTSGSRNSRKLFERLSEAGKIGIDGVSVMVVNVEAVALGMLGFGGEWTVNKDNAGVAPDGE